MSFSNFSGLLTQLTAAFFLKSRQQWHLLHQLLMSPKLLLLSVLSEHEMSCGHCSNVLHKKLKALMLRPRNEQQMAAVLFWEAAGRNSMAETIYLIFSQQSFRWKVEYEFFQDGLRAWVLSYYCWCRLVWDEDVLFGCSELKQIQHFYHGKCLFTFQFTSPKN